MAAVPVAAAVFLIPLGLLCLSMSWKRTLEAGLLKDCRRRVLAQEKYKSEELRKAGIPPVEVSFDYFDVTLKGTVASPADRQSIRQEVDQLSGARCGEAGIAGLSVLPRLEATRDEAAPDVLKLSGHLKDDGTLEAFAALIRRGEPTVKLDTSGMQLDPAVLALEPSVPSSVLDVPAHPRLAVIWRKVNVAQPQLTMDYTGTVPKLSGRVPDEKLREALLSVLTASRADLKLDATAVTVDPVLPPVSFAPVANASTWAPPAWMRPVWDSWTVYPALEATVTNGTVTLSGVISSAALRETVVNVLRRARPDLFFGPPKNLAVKNGSLDQPLIVKATEDFAPPPWLASVWQKVLSAPAPPR